MAKKSNTEKSEETKVVETKVETNVVPEDKYFISDFLANPSIFGTDDVVVKTALEMAGKTEYTKTEAMKIVNEFKNKEV